LAAPVPALPQTQTETALMVPTAAILHSTVHMHTAEEAAHPLHRILENLVGQEAAEAHKSVRQAMVFLVKEILEDMEAHLLIQEAEAEAQVKQEKIKMISATEDMVGQASYHRFQAVRRFIQEAEEEELDLVTEHLPAVPASVASVVQIQVVCLVCLELIMVLEAEQEEIPHRSLEEMAFKVLLLPDIYLHNIVLSKKGHYAPFLFCVIIKI
jgi:hypothetical protein